MHGAHEARMEAHDETQKDMLKNIRELAKGQTDIRERLVAQEKDNETTKQRLGDQEQHTRAVTKMSMAIEYMADQVKEAIVLLKEHDGRISDLERVPNDEIKSSLDAMLIRVGNLERGPGDLLVGWGKLAVGAIITGSVGLAVGAIFM